MRQIAARRPEVSRGDAWCPEEARNGPDRSHAGPVCRQRVAGAGGAGSRPTVSCDRPLSAAGEFNSLAAEA
ncbi:hypothetical protein GCM10009673_16960 [Nesterenkonia sandarakina]